MAESELSGGVISSLAGKLDQFAEVLTTDERAVLLGLLGIAGSAIESGHRQAESEGLTADRATLARPTADRLPPPSKLISDAFRDIPKLRPGGGGGGPAEDSIGVGWLCVSWSKDLLVTRPGDKVINPGGEVRIPGLNIQR